MLESAAAESFDPNDASVGDMTVSTDIIRLLQLFAQTAVIVAIASDIPAAGQQLHQTTPDRAEQAASDDAERKGANRQK